jgi:DNA mismatch endonuclease (patch repair protein)
MDHLTPVERSLQMARMKSTNTGPEIAVRRLLHALGYRYRIHERNLPGKPDIVFTARRKVIFVHGCFWHQHLDCRRASKPKSNTGYWSQKLQRNVLRDAEHLERLAELGWETFVVWECDLRETDRLCAALTKFLGPPRTLRSNKRSAA